MERFDKILQRADILIIANIVAMGFCFLTIVLLWISGTVIDPANFGNFSSKVLIAAGFASIFAFVNATFFIYPASKRDLKERTQMSKETVSLQKQATTDALTGMNNRRYFEEALNDYLREFNNIGATLGLLVLDLDHFKSVNDNFGHDVGDLVLREVALRLRAGSREHDIVARLGGEEFAVITPYATKEQLLSIAERYREMIGILKIKTGSNVICPTVSIGVATNENGENNPDDLFKAADRKLYEAKKAGRNRVAA